MLGTRVEMGVEIYATNQAKKPIYLLLLLLMYFTKFELLRCSNVGDKMDDASNTHRRD
jgi:hypothetical protein